MSVVKIHTDDLQAIYDILGDLLSRKQGRPSASAAEDLRNRAGTSRKLVGTMLGIGAETLPIVFPGEVLPEPPAPEPATTTPETPPEPTVEKTVEAIAADITPEVGPLEALHEAAESNPELASPEGDEA